jgi:ATP-dependent Clp protease protease subunit
MTVNVGINPYFIRFIAEINQHNVGELSRRVADAANRAATDIHILFSSTGGEIDAGFALYNALRAIPRRVVLYNAGAIHSAAVLGFVGVDERYCSASSHLLIHPVMSEPVSMTAAQLAVKLEQLRAAENQLDEVLRARTRITEELTAARRAGDVYLDARQCVDTGFASEIAEFALPAGVGFN